MSKTHFDLVAGTEEFYLDADYYDYEFKSRKSDVEWYVKHYLEADGPVLELGVGSGRIAVPAVRKGACVTGVDLSETMIEQAKITRSKLSKSKQSNLILHHGDMRCFDLETRFDLVTIPFNAFMPRIANLQESPKTGQNDSGTRRGYSFDNKTSSLQGPLSTGDDE